MRNFKLNVNVHKGNDVNKVNVKVIVNKVNVKVNVNTRSMAAVGRHHRRGAAALRPRHLFCGFLCSGYE